MKKLLKFLLENKILIIILLIIAIGFPTAIFKKAQGEETTIVVAVGIDRENDKYKISIQTANSLAKGSSSSQDGSNTSTAKLEVIDENGDSITDALNKLEIKTGKRLGFEHCHLIVLSDSITSLNCKNVLDYFYRKANITLGAFLISTDESAKLVLEKTCESENTSTSNLQNNLGFNKNNFSSANLTTIGDFFNDYYSQSKTSSMAFLKSETVAKEGSSTIENNGESAIFFEGKKIDVVSKEITAGLNFVNLEKVTGKMVIKNVTDDVFSDATVSINIEEGEIKKSLSIKSDSPTLNLNISLKTEILEINGKSDDIELNSGSNNFLTEGLKNKIKEKITNEINNFYLYCKNKQIDVCRFYNYLYAYKNKEYIMLINSIGKAEILNNCKLNIKIEVNAFN